MVVRPMDNRLDIPFNHDIQDKGFMQRSHLLDCIMKRLEDRHPGCISTGHKCLRVKMHDECATAYYETSNESEKVVSHSCDLLVGADGVNSAVRKYVALRTDSKCFGHMTAYRFLVPSPSKELLAETQDRWNLSVGHHIHSPCYHISSEGTLLNVVVLEYDGKAPGPPRPAKLEEIQDVAIRSKLSFVIDMLDREEITNLMCYSTYHVDCEPWHQPSAVIIGDAAHAYGPLTAKMANLAINDAYTLAAMLNDGKKLKLTQNQLLQEWEKSQRPKFEATRIRTLRHLQLYMPGVRFATKLLWQTCPTFMLKYFGSIFAYDYELYQSNEKRVPHQSKCHPGIVGVANADPLVPFVARVAAFLLSAAFLFSVFLILGRRLSVFSFIEIWSE